MTNRQAAIAVIKKLHKAGFTTLLAGGCVRDMLLNRPAKDHDVVTDARPKDVIALFKRTLEIGAKFGVVIVLLEDQQVEVATFRTETGYTDGRHPGKVEFADAKADAARRDFTINGMFYDPLEKCVLDYAGGQADLEKKIIKTIGNPAERFAEDYLRLLRAVRFATQLDFTIEPQTFSAVRKNSGNIRIISAERIAMELETTLTNPNRKEGIRLLIDSKLIEAIFDGFKKENVRFGSKVLAELRERVDLPLALAALFADCQTDFAIEMALSLKLSNNHIRHLRFLLDKRGRLLDAEIGLADLKMLLGTPYFRDLYELERAMQKAKGQSCTALSAIKKRAGELKGVDLRPKPLLNGHELIKLGAQPGPMVGLIAEEMYIAQLAEQIDTKKQAECWVTNWLKRREDMDR